MNFAAKVLAAELGQTHLFSLGQAGYIIKSAGGQLLGIDMYLSNCVERIEGHMGFKRLLPQILAPQDLLFDSIIATHPHYDHFDMDAIPTLVSDNRTHLYASENCKMEMRKLGLTDRKVSYVKQGDIFSERDFTLEFVPCDHGAGAPDAVGVVITVDHKKIYEAGDTCLRLDRVEVYQEKGPFDILIAPINGAYGNMNERECAQFSHALNPKITIPCHYGMFASHGGNPGMFYDVMKKEYPENKVLLMTLGEELIL